MSERRTLLGRSTSLVAREAIWQLPDGLEIQSKENYEVVRRRVLYEDIVFVTFHRRYGVAYLLLTGLTALLFLTIAVSIIASMGFSSWPATIVFVVIGFPALIAFALRLMFRVDVITVFGKRTKAAIRFRLRKKRARDTYEQIIAAVGAAQTRLAREIAAEDAAIAAEERVAGDAPPLPDRIEN